MYSTTPLGRTSFPDECSLQSFAQCTCDVDCKTSMVTLEDGNLGTVIERSKYPERQQKDGPRASPTLLLGISVA